MENSIYQPPCINCITFPVCRFKINRIEFSLFEYTKRYFTDMTDENKYYYCILSIYKPLFDLCDKFRKYFYSEPITQHERYIELKNLFLNIERKSDAT